jgi:hypothetical protein
MTEDFFDTIQHFHNVLMINPTGTFINRTEKQAIATKTFAGDTCATEWNVLVDVKVIFNTGWCF